MNDNRCIVNNKTLRRLKLFVVLTFLLVGPHVRCDDDFTLTDVEIRGLTPWGAWSACDKTCGGGTQIRVRTCTDPPPSSGAMNCIRHTEEQARLCHNAECPDLTYFEQDCLEAHNFYRAKHGVPPLTWNNNLKHAARKYSVHLFNFEIHLVHDEITLQRTFQGENLGKYVTDPSFPLCRNKTDTANDCIQCHDVIKLWYEEHIHYNFTSGEGLGTGEILHLTQLLWKSTSQLGMAAIRGKFELILVARYYIGGNFVTPYDFRENVPPPLKEPTFPSTVPGPARPSSTVTSQTSNILATQTSNLPPTTLKFLRASIHPTVTSSVYIGKQTPKLSLSSTHSLTSYTAGVIKEKLVLATSTVASKTPIKTSRTSTTKLTASTVVSTTSNTASKIPLVRSAISTVASTTSTEASKELTVASSPPTKASTTSTVASTASNVVSTSSIGQSATSTAESTISSKASSKTTTMSPTTSTVVSTTENPTTARNHQGNCENDFGWCEEFAAAGYCDGSFAYFMLSWCREACGACDGKVTSN